MSTHPSFTPLNIITGFLGSGKTTLLSHLLTHGLAGRRVAVILNELGETGLEPTPGSPRQEAENFNFTELASGCVCCTINTELRAALDELTVKLDPEIIVLETTGVADPHSLLLSLHGARRKVELLACVVDVANFEAASRQSPIVETQVREADLLILNKTDLSDPEDVANIEAVMEALNPHAPRIKTTFGRLDLEGLLGSIPTSGVTETAAAPLISDNHGFTSLCLSPAPLAWSRLSEMLTRLPPSVCRVKGSVDIQDKGLHNLQYSFGRWELEPAKTSQPAKIVLIGPGVDWHSDVTRLFK